MREPFWFPKFMAARLLGLFVLLVFIMPALAHSFYPWECCSNTDCWPTGADGREPDPVFTPRGWKLADGVIVPFDQARPSPDGKFHVCRRGGQADGALIVPDKKLPCLWAPEGAS